MNIAISTVEFVLMIALIGVLALRQVKGTYADRRSMWKAPLVLAAVGLATLPATVTGFRPVDALLLAVELLVAVLIGIGMGALTTASPAPDADRRGRRVRIRTGWRGAALWIVFIAARLSLRPVAVTIHAQVVTSTGVVLLLVAVARAATARIVVPKIIAATPVPSGAAPNRAG